MNHYEPFIEFEFRRHGIRTATKLRKSLGVSQPTLFRLLAGMGRRVIRLGRGRSTQYALAREIASHGSRWPLYSIDAQGRPEHVGLLHSLHDRQWCLEQDEPWDALRGNEFPHGIYPDLPWFLDDLRPQGFLGRAFARVHGRALGFQPDPRVWSADDVLMVLLRFGQDLQGSFAIGESMLTAIQERRMNPPESLPEEARSKAYPKLADEMLAGQ